VRFGQADQAADLPAKIGADVLFGQLLSLPIYPRLTDDQVDAVCTAIADIAQGHTSVMDGAADAIDTVTDLHGSADYKREMAQVFLRRALRIAASRAMGESVDARYPHTVVC